MSVPSVVGLLAHDLLRRVAVTFVVAGPLSYWGRGGGCRTSATALKWNRRFHSGPVGSLAPSRASR